MQLEHCPSLRSNLGSKFWLIFYLLMKADRTEKILHMRFLLAWLSRIKDFGVSFAS